MGELRAEEACDEDRPNCSSVRCVLAGELDFIALCWAHSPRLR